MRRTRVIPSLLLKGSGFYKTKKFKKPIYLGDPINIIRIFNDKEVDEILILDIAATVSNLEPRFDLLTDVASECFVPLGYGGGISRLDHVKRILDIGFEKVCINSAAVRDPELISKAATFAGAQSIVYSMDVKTSLFGSPSVYIESGRKRWPSAPVEIAKQMEAAGAGEILLTSIDRDGTMQGYDVEVTRTVSDAVAVPVIACGGAGSVQDFVDVVNHGHASAVAAGALFVFHGPHRAVLINVPEPAVLDARLR